MTCFYAQEIPTPPHDGEGIMGVFQSVFPIKDFNETATLEIREIRGGGGGGGLEKPKYDTEECTAARHDLCRTAEGDVASDRV